MYPVRFCLKSTGPGEESFTSNAMGRYHRGDSMITIEDSNRSPNRFIQRPDHRCNGSRQIESSGVFPMT